MTFSDAPSVPGSVLRELVAPMQPEEFTEHWWGRRALFIKGEPDKFSALFDRERFMSAVRYGADRPHLPTFRLSAVIRDFDGEWTRTEMIDPEAIPGALAEGSTVCVNDISAGDKLLRRFCDAVRQEMRFAGSTRCNAYLSDDDCGVDTHIDTSITTVLQLEGRKRWRFGSQPALAWPRSNAQVQRDGTRVWSLPWIGHEPWEQLDELRDQDFDEVVLKPGDLLCLPAGTWHRTRALGGSLALNLAFKPIDFLAALGRLLEPMFAASAEWRGGIPPVYANGAAGTELPEAVVGYFEARLTELLERLQMVSPADEDVTALWRALTE